MAPVVFVDTSVMCNIIPVPGRDQDREAVMARLAELRESRAHMILPITSVIETGNFVGNLKDGTVRRDVAQRFVRHLELVISNRAPWRLHEVEWGAEFIRSLISGADTETDLVGHAMHGVGTGDLCILTERLMYRRRSRLQDVEIWSMDAKLSAHS
ncbi:MAG: hypothetical protein ACFCVF_13915 [Kineosporiaceae bacterium]